VVDQGKIVYRLPPFDNIRAQLEKRLKRFPAALGDIRRAYKYPVLISPGLGKLKRTLVEQLQKMQ
jgi:hypothetical protein